MLKFRKSEGLRRGALVAGAADQAVVSLYSLVSLVIAARSLEPAQLGVFTSALVVYQVLIVVARALHGEPLVVLASDRGSAKSARKMLVASVFSSIPLSAIGALVFVASSSGLWRAIAVCFLFAPLIVGYDSLRYTFIATLTTQRLLAMDSLVVLTQTLVLLLVFSQGDDVVTALMAISGVYLVPLLVALVRSGGIGREALSWYSDSKRYGLSFFTESIWGALLQWALVFAIAQFAGLAEAAAFRSIVVIYGVTNVVTNFLRSTVLAAIVKRGRLYLSMAARDGGIMVAMIGLTITASCLVLLSLSPSFGAVLLGATWPLAVPYILIGAFTRFSAAVESVPGVLLRAARATWSVVRLRVAVGLASLCVCPLATALWGVNGAFYSMATMSWVLSLSLSILLIARLKRQKVENSDMF